MNLVERGEFMLPSMFSSDNGLKQDELAVQGRDSWQNDKSIRHAY